MSTILQQRRYGLQDPLRGTKVVSPNTAVANFTCHYLNIIVYLLLIKFWAQ